MDSPLSIGATVPRINLCLLAIVAAASIVCWWPLLLEPALDIPWWIPLAAVVLCSGLATVLSGGKWLLFPLIAAAATLVGIAACCRIWPLEDGIAQSYMGIAAVAAAIAVLVASLIPGSMTRKIRVPNEKRRAVWLALICVAALGPIALAVRPPIVAHRLARNERLASERVSALKDAVDRVESDHRSQACDGNALKQHYSGPAFTEKDWRFVAGNFVTEDGYAIGITIDCSQPRDYLISAMPKRGSSDGSRRICADAFSLRNCAPQWDMQRGRNSCVPCAP
jgi:hypothetical protein